MVKIQVKFANVPTRQPFEYEVSRVPNAGERLVAGQGSAAANIFEVIDVMHVLDARPDGYKAIVRVKV